MNAFSIPKNTKTLAEISREEWIVYHWHEATRVGDIESLYIRGIDRSPSDAWQRGQEWDYLQEARNKLAA